MLTMSNLHFYNKSVLQVGSKLNKEMSTNQQLFTNWSLIEETWNEHCRYKNCGDCKKKDVERFILAIEDNNIGIKQWISKQ